MSPSRCLNARGSGIDTGLDANESCWLASLMIVLWAICNLPDPAAANAAEVSWKLSANAAAVRELAHLSIQSARLFAFRIDEEVVTGIKLGESGLSFKHARRVKEHGDLENRLL